MAQQLQFGPVLKKHVDRIWTAITVFYFETRNFTDTWHETYEVSSVHINFSR